MSSFLLKKNICGKHYFSVSIWRNRPKRIECLWRPMATMLYRKQRAESFTGSMTTILTWVTRSEKSVQEGWGLSIAGSFGRGRYPIAKNACNWVFLEQPFPCGYMPWGRFKRSENGCSMNDRQMERRQNTCQILLARQKRKSFLHRIVTCHRIVRWKVDLFS